MAGSAPETGRRTLKHEDLRLERRLAPRRNTAIPAQIAFGAGRARRACVIRNLSDTGARLEVNTVVGIPNSFDLLVEGHRRQPCRVVWRALKEIGVQFVPTE
jgi:hypothetical protein